MVEVWSVEEEAVVWWCWLWWVLLAVLGFAVGLGVKRRSVGFFLDVGVLLGERELVWWSVGVWMRKC